MKTSNLKRIEWIDWAKAIGIMIVVFCHVPQHNSLEKELLCYLQMPLFFFLSGYLHKVPTNTKESILKYWNTIVIPYMLFQFIFYPYWLFQQNSEGLDVTNLSESILRPFAQCFWGIPIDGITWFLVALILMKMFTDFCYQTKLPICIGIGTILCLFISYSVWADNKLNITFAIDSMFSFYPFFIVGYFIKRHNYEPVKAEKEQLHIHLLRASCYLIISLMAIIYIPRDSYFVNRILFYVIGATGSLFIIELCKCFKGTPHNIVTISKGTIIILGLHWMFIGTTNFILKKLLQIEGEIYYSTFEATLLVLSITIANYYIIIFCQKHFKALLGGR